MKNYTFQAGLCAVVVGVSAALSVAPRASAQSFRAETFLGGSNLVCAAASTNTTGSSVAYTSGLLVTNTTWITNAAGVGVISNQWRYVWTTNTAGIVDVPLWANRDGTTVNAALVVHLNAGTVAPLTYTLTAVPGGPGKVAATGGANSWSFSLAAAATDVIVATNLPTGFMQGCGGLRLTVANTNAATAVTNRGTWLIGFSP